MELPKPPFVAEPLCPNSSSTDVVKLEAESVGKGEGTGDGAVGCLVGDKVLRKHVGAAEGCKVDKLDGRSEDMLDGCKLGEADGRNVGRLVGMGEGSNVGASEGHADGFGVGTLVGKGLGCKLGTVEGADRYREKQGWR